MTVYVDSIQQYSSGPWCHMASDDLDELHRFAANLRLRRAWFQEHAVLPHYDLRPSKRLLAIERGAIEVNSYELLALCTDKYPKLKEKALMKKPQKRCTKCNQLKSLDSFDANGVKSNGEPRLRSQCRTCRLEYNRKWDQERKANDEGIPPDCSIMLKENYPRDERGLLVAIDKLTPEQREEVRKLNPARIAAGLFELKV